MKKRNMKLLPNSKLIFGGEGSGFETEMLLVSKREPLGLDRGDMRDSASKEQAFAESRCGTVDCECLILVCCEVDACADFVEDVEDVEELFVDDVAESDVFWVLFVFCLVFLERGVREDEVEVEIEIEIEVEVGDDMADVGSDEGVVGGDTTDWRCGTIGGGGGGKEGSTGWDPPNFVDFFSKQHKSSSFVSYIHKNDKFFVIKTFTNSKLRKSW